MTQLWSWAQNNSLVFALVLLALILAFKELLLSQLRKNVFLFYVFLFPGVVLHELSHALFCLIMFAPIKKIQFFSKTGGFVVHQESKIPVVGDFLISIAPLLLGSALFYILSFKFQSAPLMTKVLIGYLEVAILITMTPSFQDIVNSAVMYVAIIIALIALVASNILKISFSPEAFRLMYFCLALLVVVNLLVAMLNSIKGKK